jgi:outer membrane protein assembly factor BamB
MHRAILAALVVAATGGLRPPLARAGDWGEFRGPGGTGHYTGPALVTEWGQEKNVAWKTSIPGNGWSSPIVANGKLFLTTAVPQGDDKKPDYSLRALCLDPKSGSILWAKEIFVEQGATVPKPHAKNSHASPTPISDGERVFVHFGHMGTACLDFAGNIAWKKQEHSYRPVHGNGGSPVLVGDAVVFSADGGDKQFVAALDKKTGDVKWKVDRKNPSAMSFSFSTPLLQSAGGRSMIVSPASGFVAGYDPTTGDELWRTKYPGPGYSVIPRPIMAGGRVVLSTGFNNAMLIAISPPSPGEATGAIAWTAKKDAPHTPTPLAAGDEIYMVSDKGIMTCLDAKSGSVHWSERLQGKGYSASPIFADGNIYVTSEEGVGQVLAAGKEFKEVSHSEMKERTFATFAAADGALYLRTESALFRFEGK